MPGESSQSLPSIIDQNSLAHHLTALLSAVAMASRRLDHSNSSARIDFFSRSFIPRLLEHRRATSAFLFVVPPIFPSSVSPGSFTVLLHRRRKLDFELVARMNDRREKSSDRCSNKNCMLKNIKISPPTNVRNLFN